MPNSAVLFFFFFLNLMRTCRKLTGRFYLYSSAYVPALVASLLAILWERKSRYVSSIFKDSLLPAQ